MILLSVISEHLYKFNAFSLVQLIEIDMMLTSVI